MLLSGFDFDLAGFVFNLPGLVLTLTYHRTKTWQVLFLTCQVWF